MEVRSEPAPISSREPFSVSMQNGPPVHSPPPTSAMPNMRMTFSSDGSSIYKQVDDDSPPPFHGIDGDGGSESPPIADGILPIEGVAHPTGPRPRLSFTADQTPKRRRGRPRKYGPDGSISAGFAQVTPPSTTLPAPSPVQQPQPLQQHPQQAQHQQQQQHQYQHQQHSQHQPQQQPQYQPQQPQYQPQQQSQHQPQQPQQQSQTQPQPEYQSPPPGFSQSQPQPDYQSQPPPGFSSPMGMGTPVSPPHSEGTHPVTVMKKRGRPLGSVNSKKRQPVGSDQSGFDPHVITVNTGEDVSAKIMSFLQHGPQAVCILSANGAISNVTIRQPATSGGTVTYEGRFEILSLSGSYFLTEIGGQRSRTGGLSISLAGPDGRLLGGGIAGVLTAASPVQLVLGCFNVDVRKEHRENTSYDPLPKIRLSQGNLGSSSPSRGTFSEPSGRPGSPFNQTTIIYNNGTPQGMPGQWQ